MKPLLAAALTLCVVAVAGAIGLERLSPSRSIPPELAGRFREASGFQQSSSGQYFVFDRRAHRVYGVDTEMQGLWDVVEIGAEPGRILDPTAFAVAPDGSFVVADAPSRHARLQIFTPAGFRTGGFFIEQAGRPRLIVDNTVMSGIGSLQYTGREILLSQPERGALVSVYGLDGTPQRSIGTLRATGHESDPDVHVALNSGIPIVVPSGGLFFVFQAGVPVFRRYDAEGRLLYERPIQGQEVDALLPKLPSAWPRNPLDGELPLVRPTIRAAALDRSGYLWMAFDAGFTYVFDADGDKVRAVQFRGAGPLVPTTMFFGVRGQLLVTPGLHEYDVQ